MNILFIDSQYPTPDRASADVRMFTIIQLLRKQGHECTYYASDIHAMEMRFGVKEVCRYRDELRQLGVCTREKMDFEQVISRKKYDSVFFKYFYSAENRIRLVRIWQPEARLVVDSVDLVYARLVAKAKLSGLKSDSTEAESVMARELATYAAADCVITVTQDEAQTLREILPSLFVDVIPNIHAIPTTNRSETSFPSLLFIGTFTHEPNVDGILWFVKEVWPSVRASHPDTQLRVVGGNPPPEILALGEEGIEIKGYVPDTLPFLMESWVSVAPLRFGAGMKGKVGEAMAAGLPVITTSFGAEGFGLVPGIHLLVANDPIEFSKSVSTVIANRTLRDRLGSTGRLFIESHYSPAAVSDQLKSFVQRLTKIEPKRVAFAPFLRWIKHYMFWHERNILWRLRKKASI